MVDLAVFAALGWERRAVTDALGGVEPAGRPQTWRGRLGDGASCLVMQTGVGDARARVAAEAVTARAFLACGCAGALVPVLAAGDVVVAAGVVALDRAGDAGERLLAESGALAAAVTAAGLSPHVGDVVSSPVVLATAAAKRAAAACGALVVEMESWAIAEVAARRGIPFGGLRVVLDGVHHAIPAGLAVVDGATGELCASAVVRLALRPGLWPALVRLARQGRIADTSLRRALAAVLGRGLAGLGIAAAGPHAAAR